MAQPRLGDPGGVTTMRARFTKGTVLLVVAGVLGILGARWATRPADAEQPPWLAEFRGKLAQSQTVWAQADFQSWQAGVEPQPIPAVLRLDRATGRASFDL